jgi:hypothetical protein
MVLGLAAGCATPLAPWPSWVEQPKREDSVCLYALGHATRASSESAARNAAYQDGIAQFSQMVLTKSGVDGVAASSGVELEWRGVEMVAGGVSAQRRVGGWEAYILVSWPRADHDRMVARLNLGTRLNGLWAESGAAAAARQWELAIGKIEVILREFHDPLDVRFSLEEARRELESLKNVKRGAELNQWWAQAQSDFQGGRLAEARIMLDKLLAAVPFPSAGGPSLDMVKLLAGELCERQTDLGGARRWYGVLAESAADPGVRQLARIRLEALPPPPRFWPMNERWGGVKVALVCVIREGGVCRQFPALAQILQKDCLEARMTVIDESSSLRSEAVGMLFGSGDSSQVVQDLRQRGAGVILAVQYDIDPALKNKVEDVGGVAMPLPDAHVGFVVIRADTGKIIHRGLFKAITDGKGESRLAPYAATVLITKYLVPSCPTVK